MPVNSRTISIIVINAVNDISVIPDNVARQLNNKFPQSVDKRVIRILQSIAQFIVTKIIIIIIS